MDQPSKMHDLTEKNVKSVVKTNPEKWKKQALYNMPTNESTSKAAQEGIPYRDGKRLLARQRQQAYQKDSYVTPTLSDRPRSWHPRQGSDVQHKLSDGISNTSELGEPKGWKNNLTLAIDLKTPKIHTHASYEWNSEDSSKQQS